jgi:hypothetical protein
MNQAPSGAASSEYAAPTGLNFYFGFGSTNMPRQRRWGREVAERRDDNSPAFQCRDQSANIPSPGGTTDVFKMKSRTMVEPMRHPFSRPGGTGGRAQATRR